MRGILIISLVVLCLAGCQSVTGPFMPRTPERVDDPRFSISEQESRGRNRWAMPDESARVAPRSGFAMPGLMSNGDR